MVASTRSSSKNIRVLSGGKLQPGTVVFEGVSKTFRKHSTAKKSYTTIKSRLLDAFLFRKSRTSDLIQALDHLSLDITPGQALGVIGKNGSGKSTLLKLIAGIYRPDAGNVRRAGTISALIELGAGFHPDFTGRENIYLGGVMFGLSRREIDQRFNDIVKFAELADFIDDPVRTYSSGMYMRLGFSLAVHTDPDILLIDEVLAVGDASFIHRCQERISDFKRRGKTLIFVTHDLDSVVRWCDEVIWLDKGRVCDRGEPRRIVDHYLQKIEADEKKQLQTENEEREVECLQQLSEPVASPTESEELLDSPPLQRWGNGDVRITQVIMKNHAGEQQWLFHDQDQVVVSVRFEICRPIDELVFGIGILRADGVVVSGTNTQIEEVDVPVPAPDAGIIENRDGVSSYNIPLQGEYTFTIDRLGLVDENYFLDVAAHRSDGTPYDYHHRMYKFTVRSSHRFHGVVNLPHSWQMKASYPVREDFKAASKKGSVKKGS